MRHLVTPEGVACHHGGPPPNDGTAELTVSSEDVDCPMCLTAIVTDMMNSDLRRFAQTAQRRVDTLAQDFATLEGQWQAEAFHKFLHSCPFARTALAMALARDGEQLARLDT